MSTQDPRGLEPDATTSPDPAVEETDPTTGATQVLEPDETSAQPAPETSPVRPERDVRAPRVGTVVWGLVLAVLGVGVLAWAAGRQIDVDVAAIVLVAGAGVALLVGSVVSGVRRRG
ncbi:hypothetical protein [Cellulomonas uda]|uniref:Uncharacterized protein n=1 Tax=Cellulomonas uda TaxID=1714 RepID=A0A4Y3KDC5_CELUD|nr:hypothetical protein [Cellulomonas uda]NII65086.1 hypothetical protein [Cellulomonas uda]GEA81015.1 hypothetical protein CUD01_14590 [Cellulomonas uda]